MCKQNRATIFGAALSICLSYTALAAHGQSPSADLEAVEAVEVPLRIEKQGPICGKMEVGQAPSKASQESVKRVKTVWKQGPAQPTQAATQAPQVTKAVAAPTAAELAAQEQIASRQASQERAARERETKERAVELRTAREQTASKPQTVITSTQQVGKFNQAEHVKEFNWLSDEPVSETAAKFAANAKKESIEKSDKTGKSARTTRGLKSSNKPAPTDESIVEQATITPRDSDQENTPSRATRMTTISSAIPAASSVTAAAAISITSKKNGRIDPSSVKVAKKPHCSGVADYYADHFHGLKTASGQIHDREKYTAAHRTLPFGTKLKVVNRNTGKACIVTVNDRGPFTPSRVIDLSAAAAKELGLVSAKSRMVDCYIVENETSTSKYDE